MHPIQKIMKNTGASFIIRIAKPLSSFGLVLLISRTIGVNGIGTFSAALSILYIFQAVACMGFEQLITREVAQDHKKATKFLVNCSFIGFWISLIVAGLMSIAANYITQEEVIVEACYILSLSLVPYTLGLVGNSICRAFEKYEFVAIAHLSANIFNLAAGAFFLLKGCGILTIVRVILAGHLVMFLLSLVFAWICIKKEQAIDYRLDADLCRWILRTSPVFSFIIITYTVRWNVDNLILTKMLGADGVGFYSAADKLMKICNLGTASYIMALQPIIFRQFKTSFQKFRKTIDDSIRFLFILIFPIIVGTGLLSQRFILLVYKEAFLPSASVLTILIVILFFTGNTLIIGNALMASNHQRINLQGNIICMVCNVIFNFVLVPFLGFIGAAIASLLTSMCFFIHQYLFFSKYLFSISYLKCSAKPLLASIIMGIGVLLMRDMNLFIIVVVSAAVYMIAIALLKVFTREDIRIFKELFQASSKHSA